jgi:hypothetical protein
MLILPYSQAMVAISLQTEIDNVDVEFDWLHGRA